MKNQLSGVTAAGLLLGLFGAPALIYVFNLFTEGTPLTNGLVLLREAGLFLITGLLLVLVAKGEKLPLRSIGLHNSAWGASVKLAGVILLANIVLLAGLLGIFHLLQIPFGESGESSRYGGISLQVFFVIVLRAGIIEEICYRGYVQERLKALFESKWMYIYLPSLIFGVVHYRQGVSGVIIATAAGLLLAFFYERKRDLKANIIAHFLVDFIPNVLIPLISGLMT
jgi:membrane protease YdiL (CAAX protease family)